MATEIQNFLDYIKSMGIEAWIPDTPGHGSKMTIPDQCRSKVLCLEYEGTDIYIRGNPCLTKNVKNSASSYKNNKPVGLKNNTANGSGGDTNTAYYKICNKISQPCNFFDSENVLRKYSYNLGTNMSHQQIPKEHLQCPAAECLFRQWWTINNINKNFDSKSIKPNYYEQFIKAVKCVENKNFLPEMQGGQQFKRIVHEKLSREVRVAKCYVSSLPSRSEKVMENKDCENPIKVKKCTTKHGFVRQLIKLFNACDDCTEKNIRKNNN